MIMNMKPLHLADVSEFIKDLEEKKELKEYLKKFTKLSKDKADKLAEELRALDNLKIKEEQIVKMVDFLPRTAEDLNKIFNDVSLDEKETNDVLSIIGRY